MSGNRRRSSWQQPLQQRLADGDERPVSTSALRIFIASGTLLISGAGQAGVSTDGRLGPIQTLPGPNMTIPQNLGTAVGPNLFHSFSTFNIDTGESATFTSTAPFDNVISRVTGGLPSNIQGTLGSTIFKSDGVSGADFWFINPAGIVFGEGALLQVPGAFHANTADYVTLGDCGSTPTTCGQFSASQPDASSLAVAAPERFGFLDSTPAGIQVNGGILQVPLSASLSLIGGDITVAGGILYAQSGSIHLTSVASAGEVAADPTDLTTTVTDFGQVSLTGATVLADGLPRLTRGGRVLIRGGTVVADASNITANHAGSETGGGIAITATEAITLSSASTVEIANSGSGNPGTLILSGGNILLTSNSTLVSRSNSVGPGATLSILGDDILINTGSRISSSGLQRGAADIALTATGSIRIDGAGPTSAGISSAVFLGNQVDVSSVNLQAADQVSLLSGAVVASQTSGAGGASPVSVTAADILIDGSLTLDRFTGITSQTVPGATGSAGTVTLTGATIAILGNGEVSSNTFSTGSAGSVTVNADTLLIDGTAGSTDTFTGISSGSQDGAAGNAGTIAVTSGTTTVLNRGIISSNTSGSGTAGTVTVSSATILIDGRGTPVYFTGISSDSTGTASGAAGAVSVSGDDIRILGGGHVSSTTAGTGAGGQVTLTGGTILIDATGAPDGITDVSSRSLPGAAANAGRITVRGDAITLRSGGEISSSTFNSGDAGRVLVAGGTVLLDGAGAPAGLTGIFSQSNRGVSGNGGTITIEGRDVEVRNGGAIGTNTDGTGNAGDIVLTGQAGDPPGSAQILIAGAGSRISSLSSGTGVGSGKAGNISVDAESLVLADQAVLLASTNGTGAGGDVRVDASLLRIADGGSISAASVAPAARVQAQADLRLGPAGSLFINAADLLLLSGGTLSTSSTTSGGGNIDVLSAGTVRLDQGAITASAQGLLPGDSGGNVTIRRPAFLILDSGQVRADANAGAGGNILIDAVGFVASADSIVSATSAQAVDGQVTNTSENTVSGVVEVELPDVTPAEPVRTSCAAARLQNRSSLVLRDAPPGAVLVTGMGPSAAPTCTPDREADAG